ncbi:MAG: hypothetical protein CMO80_03680 [Verrucomicrobiales bacterium]|nr:hypothetical protein [Verrucomicrobiales bacterium]
MKKHFAIIACFLAAALTFNASAGERGFKKIFNGRNLDGWRGNPELWSVEDDAITGTTTAENKIKHNTFLVWDAGKLKNFELRLQYKIGKVGNSGIQYRAAELSQGDFGPIVGGYQADFEAGKKYSGILYEERGRGILALRGEKVVIKGVKEVEIKRKGKTIKRKQPDKEVTGSVGKSEDIQAKIKAEDWNDYRIVAKGNHLQHFINGVKTVEVTDNDEANAAKQGILAFQIHVGPPMKVQFRNVRVKNL